MQEPVLQGCMSQLYEKNPKLYEELKKRQISYISVINELRNENQRLKILLQQQNNNSFNPSNTFPIHNSPSYNFSQISNNSTIHKIIDNKSTVNQRFSFADKDQHFQKISINSGNSYLKHSPLYQGSQKIIINYSTPIPRHTSPTNFFSNILNPQSAQISHQINRRARQPAQNFQIQNQKRNQQSKSNQKKENIWQTKTNKSIHKDESNLFETRRDHQNDQGYSQIVDRQSSSKLHFLIGSESEINDDNAPVEKNSTNRLVDKTLQYSSSIYLTPSLQSIPHNQQKSNVKYIEKDSGESFSKRNRPIISNRVYL